MKLSVFTAGFLVALAFVACSNERKLFSPDDVGTLVVDAMLYVDKPVPQQSIVLYRAQSPSEPLNIRQSGESNATVTMSTGSATYYFGETLKGAYWLAGRDPPDAPMQIQPETTYRLEVVTQSGERLTATTTTPPRLTVADWVVLDDLGVDVDRRLRTFADLRDSVYYAPENQLTYTEGLLEARLNPVVTAAYQAGISALDPDSGFVFDPAFLEEEDFEEFEPDIASPPILNSETRIRLPWFAIYYKGRYKIKIFAVDRNWYDLARTVPDFAGGGGFGGNVGDDFERPIFHVNGGIGIFGSASMDSVGFTVHPRPE